MKNPKCFISYSWDSEEHKEWVRKLAINLQSNGVITLLDQWDTYPGIDLIKYMETSIRESDYVILVCTPNFTQKANLVEGGVGYEKIIVTGEIYHKLSPQKKYVPIIRNGKPKECLPSYLKTRVYLDFSNDNKYQDNIEKLLRHIHAQQEHKRPSLGTKPIFDNKLKKDKSKESKKSFNLIRFKNLFDYAYSASGLDMSKSAALNWALNKIGKT